MVRAIVLWPFILVLSALSAFADARITVLVDVLKLDEAATILSQEGMVEAQNLNRDMLEGQGGPGWSQQVESIYAPARMVELIRSEFEADLTPEAVEAVITFYASDIGAQIIALENAARQAIQDPQVEDAARARYTALKAADDPRLALVTELINGGDMISRNVTSSLNSNFQFLRGLVDGDAIKMSEEEMLKDASRDIEASTEDTIEWLSGYMLLAYHPISDDDLRDYVTFSQTDAGQAFNTALFAGFGKAYEDISYALGRAVALNMTAQEL